MSSEIITNFSEVLTDSSIVFRAIHMDKFREFERLVDRALDTAIGANVKPVRELRYKVRDLLFKELDARFDQIEGLISTEQLIELKNKTLSDIQALMCEAITRGII